MPDFNCSVDVSSIVSRAIAVVIVLAVTLALLIIVSRAIAKAIMARIPRPHPSPGGARSLLQPRGYPSRGSNVLFREPPVTSGR